MSDYEKQERTALLTTFGTLIGEQLEAVEVGQYDITLTIGRKKIRLHPTNSETIAMEVVK